MFLNYKAESVLNTLCHYFIKNADQNQNQYARKQANLLLRPKTPLKP